MQQDEATPASADATGIPIGRFLPHMERRTFRKGEILFRQGDPADAMFYIAEGTVGLREVGKGLGPGAVLGEMGLLSPVQRRTASAVCEQDLVVYRMDRRGLLSMMDQAPRDVFTLIQLAIARYSENLENEATARGRMEGELRVAREIQLSSLPDVATALPPQVPLDLFATMDSAKEVGGDFYDFFLVDGKTLFLAVGDVSGKGVPAALFMMTVKTLLKAEAMSGLPPDEVLGRVNRTIGASNAASMFATLLCAAVDFATGRVTFGNAGHCPPLIKHGDAPFRFADVPPSPVLGLLPQARFTSAAAQLAPGDALLLYTDGVTEATDSAGQFYAEARLLRAVRGVPAARMADLVIGVRDDVRAFANGAAQSDDVTILAIRYRGDEHAAVTPSGGGASPARHEETPGALQRLAQCRMPANTENLPAFHAVAVACAGQLGLARERVADIDLAVEEVFANIARHAYPGGSGDIELRCHADRQRLLMEFVDWGIPFDVLAQPPPVLPSDIAKREIGGLGIFLVRKIMDEVHYRREADCNVLTLVVHRA